MTLPRTVRVLQVMIEAEALVDVLASCGVEVRFEELPPPEYPRIPNVNDYLVAASGGTPTKGPQPRRRFPVRR